MKLTKAEKIWLAAVIIFFFLYNLPFFPAYHHAKATVIHALLTIIPLWFCVYFGLIIVCRKFRLKKKDSSEKPQAEDKEENTSC